MKKQSIWMLSALISLLIFMLPSMATAAPDSFASIVKKERQKVVHISTSAIVKGNNFQRNPFFDRFFPDMPKERRQSALGSGFIISEDGYIVTNNHVVEKADKIRVTLYDEREFDAEVIGTDPRTDLALIKIEGSDLPRVIMGDSEKLEIGDWVIAIGNPLGLDHSVTAGILSARGRDIFGGTAYGQFLQTDAAINPGNSGGPLFDVDGEVIGINTAIVAGGQGLGFAIPINLAKKVIKQLKATGKVQRGWFGVGIQDVDRSLAESFGLPKGLRGVAITSVLDGSPADKAGIQEGDIILEVNDHPLRKATQLQQFVAETAPEETIRVKLFRNGKTIHAKVTVGLAPVRAERNHQKDRSKFGMELAEITPQLRERLQLKNTRGVLVVNLDQTGLAWEAGLRKGDVITKVNNKVVNSLSEFQEQLKQNEKRKSIALLVQRRGQPLFIALPNS